MAQRHSDRTMSSDVRTKEGTLRGLEQVADRIWLAEGPIVDFYRFPYPTRMVVIALEGGALWIWSPVKLTPELQDEVDRLGTVAHLVSPNKIHHLFLAEWKRAYPNATLWGPASTCRRETHLSFGPPLEVAPPPEWGPDIDQAWFRGSFAMDEVVFFHRPSRTAIFADLIEAFSDTFLHAHWSWWQRPLARLDGITAQHPGAPREWRFSFIDRGAARAARAKVLAWNPERVIMAHGAWRRSGGRTYIARALSWLGATPGG